MKLFLIISFLFSTAFAQQKEFWHTLNNSAFFTTDADVNMFITKVSNNGGFLTKIEKQAVDNLVKQLKDSSLWTKFLAIYPFVGGTRLSCGVNLKDTTLYNITFVAGNPSSYTKFGATRAGLTSTGIIPLSVMSATTGHLSFYSRTNPGAGGIYDMGASDDAGTVVKPVAVIGRYTGNLAYGLYGTGTYTTNASNSDSRGMFLTSHISGVTRIYKNGVSLDNTTETPALPNRAIYLFAINAGGTESFISNKQFAFASVGSGFTVAEALTFYNIVQIFQTRLSRQV